jgi:hypothetical protein
MAGAEGSTPEPTPGGNAVQGTLLQAATAATHIVNSSHLGPVWHAVQSNLGDSSHLNEGAAHPQTIMGFVLPVIPPGVPTTLIPVAFPLTTEAPEEHISKAKQEFIVLMAFLFAGLLWVLPWLCINRKLCCRYFTRCMSRRLRCYFFLGLLVNLVFISIVIAKMPDVSANDIFFSGVKLIEKFSEQLEKILTQMAILIGGFIALQFRRKIVALLGFDQQLVRADLRDIITCFSMNRFITIEISLWKMEGLPNSWNTRSLFLRVVLGYNEPQHSRPHDGVSTSIMLRERMQLNYDPEDDTQKLSIILKQQEVIGGAVSQLAPVAGLMFGAAGGALTPLGPTAGAGIGAVTGVGAANSLGIEVARVDLSSAQINRFRKMASEEPAGRIGAQASALATGPSVPWKEDKFMKVDLVPQGECWLRITDVEVP